MSLQGTLRTLGITEVLEFLADRNATGRLSIEADSGAATYMMVDGEVLIAQYAFDHEAGTDAAEATYYALAELDGTFLFTEEEIESADDSTESIPDLLGRTADSAEAWSTVEEVIPTRDHKLTRQTSFTKAVTVEPDWWTAIDAIGNGSTSRALTDALGQRALATSLMAADMTRAGLLVVAEPAASITEVPEIAEVAEIHTAVEAEIASDEATGTFLEAPDTTAIEAVAETEYAADPIANMFADHSAPAASDPVVESVNPAVAAQELEDAMSELEAIASDSAFYSDPAETDSFVDPAAPSPFEPAPTEGSAFEATPDFSSDAPASDAFDEGISTDDGWASDHGAASTPSPFAEEPATPDTGVWGDIAEMPSAPEPPAAPQPEDPFSALSPVAMFGGLPEPDAAQEHSNLAYLNAPEPAMPTFPDETGQEALAEGVEDEFATEDRSSVLKFLRRD